MNDELPDKNSMDVATSGPIRPEPIGPKPPYRLIAVLIISAAFIVGAALGFTIGLTKGMNRERDHIATYLSQEAIWHMPSDCIKEMRPYNPGRIDYVHTQDNFPYKGARTTFLTKNGLTIASCTFTQDTWKVLGFPRWQMSANTPPETFGTEDEVSTTH